MICVEKLSVGSDKQLPFAAKTHNMKVKARIQLGQEEYR